MKQGKSRSAIYITADDFGMSPGINWAIGKALTEGLITNASIVANGDCFNEAIQLAHEHSGASYGLHFNLDYGVPVSNTSLVPILLSDKGVLKNPFLKYLLLSLTPGKEIYINQLEIELKSQIEKILKHNIRLDYIDSHRHIHAVPFVNKIIKQVAKEYGIMRVRGYNESYFNTLLTSGSFYPLNPVKFFKWLVFRLLSLINKDNKSIGFYSLLLSSILMGQHARNFRIKKKYSALEIMVHVGNPDLDKSFYTSDDLTNRYIRESHRTTEIDFCRILKSRLDTLFDEKQRPDH